MKKYPTKKKYMSSFWKVYLINILWKKILQKIYSNRRIYPIVINGDITSDTSIDDKDVPKVIWKKISSAIVKNKWKKTDIIQIIHIVCSFFCNNSAYLQF